MLVKWPALTAIIFLVHAFIFISKKTKIDFYSCLYKFRADQLTNGDGL